ncbi:MAG TPA: TIGR03557 family F420-dependent LLM class oxidoreductase [Methanocella sp.]|nr:TIGR03557 family F420-dependent LLM class oxidoreductase [Methanocella sp.]
MLKLGWKAGPEQYQPTELLDYIVAAENAGFETVDVSDHFHPWAERGYSCFTWTWLGAAAVKTKKIIMGPGLTCPILRYHPSVIAQAAATMDNLAPGRTFLAVGTGEALNEYAATGMWPGYLERQEMLLESIRLIRELWKGDEVTFDGQYYRTRKARLYTPPVSSIPLYVSSIVPESSAFAGMYGDGLITMSREANILKQMIRNFEEGAKKAGKDPKKMPRMIEIAVAYTDDVDSAVRSFHDYWAGTMIPAMFNQNIYTPELSEMNGAAVGKDSILKKMCISSDPADHVKFVQQYIDMGFTHIQFHCGGPDQRAFLEGYGRDVLPRIRGRQAQMTIKA